MKPRRLKALLFAAFFVALSVGADDPAGPSLEALRNAAEQGSVDAQYELGVLYEFGFNFPDHKAAAYAWYNRAAEQGNALAQKRRDALKAELSAADIERAQAIVKPQAPATSAAAPPATSAPAVTAEPKQ